MHRTSEHPYTGHQLFMLRIMSGHEARIKQGYLIKLIKVRNTSSAMVQNHSPFLDTIKPLVKYAVAFELEYHLGFVYKSIKDSDDDMMSSVYLPS